VYRRRLKDAQTGKIMVKHPWRVVGRVVSIGYDPAPATMRSNSKHDRHSRERQRPDACMGCGITKWGGIEVCCAPNDPNFRGSATKACCGYTLEYISPLRDPSNTPHYINFLRASSIALLRTIHVISIHKRYNRPGPSFVPLSLGRQALTILASARRT
jgi:hypothetical protein